MKGIFKDILSTDGGKRKVVIVGIGNIMRGDDGFGPMLIERLNKKINMTCVDAGTTPENYVGKIAKETPDTILLVDAVHLDLMPGQYQILSPDEILKTGFTTHDISPNIFIEYLKSQTKADIYMLGIQPQNIALGDEMSDAVKETLKDISTLIREIICVK